MEVVQINLCSDDEDDQPANIGGAEKKTNDSDKAEEKLFKRRGDFKINKNLEEEHMVIDLSSDDDEASNFESSKSAKSSPNNEVPKLPLNIDLNTLDLNQLTEILEGMVQSLPILNNRGIFNVPRTKDEPKVCEQAPKCSVPQFSNAEQNFYGNRIPVIGEQIPTTRSIGAEYPYRPPLTLSVPSFGMQHKNNYHQKINLRDPRILKQMNMLQSTVPLTETEIPTTTAKLIHQSAVPAPDMNDIPAVVNPRTYGEYKRKQKDRAVEAEKRKQEAAIKASAIAKKLEKEIRTEEAEKEDQERRDDVRKIILTALEPYGDQQETKLRARTEKETTPELVSSKNRTAIAESPSTKIDRVIKELECTVIGYDKLQDYLPTSHSGKRLSSEVARFAISQQLRGEEFVMNEIATTSAAPVAKRRKSICAEQSRTKSQPKTVTPPVTVKTKPLQIRVKRLKLPKLPGRIVVSEGDVVHYMPPRASKEAKMFESEPETFRAELVEKNKKPTSTSVNVILKNKESTTSSRKRKPKEPSPKQKNIDSRMTERNTMFCVLCRSKPSDLTNHYLRRHKTESYVSRIPWKDLEELRQNTPFAVKVGHTTGVLRYKVRCPFCKVMVCDTFNNLHTHYSSHTGEYAFKCAQCNFQKPFRADIRSHQLHAKTCRDARIQLLYQYPPNLLAIYVHCCKLCCFVQLNESNVFKHLREQHGKLQEDPTCVEKYVLAAIIDQNDTATAETDAMVDAELALNDDETVTVGNEPICEDVTDGMEYNGANDTVPGDVTKQLHTAHLLATNDALTTGTAMTVVHTQDRSVQQSLSAAIDVAFKMEIKAEPTFDITEASEKEYPVLARCVPRKKYRTFSKCAKYFGYLKCMAADCFYSTNTDDDMLQHLKDHNQSEFRPEGFLQCAYCHLLTGQYDSAEDLVAHVRTKHQHSRYQCTKCCYRSCTAANVITHQHLNHPDEKIEKSGLVFECKGSELILDERLPVLKQLMRQNVQQVICYHCSTSFYAVSWLLKHYSSVHNISNVEKYPLRRFACIYCPHDMADRTTVQKHLAIKHPDELPVACERVLKPGLKNDAVDNLQLTEISLQVPPENIIAAAESNMETVPTEGMDIKPTPKELSAIAENCVKTQLVKLTCKTGIAPDILYRCPMMECGGFFSNYALWSCHMTKRHFSIIANCPHCPEDSPTELSLSAFEQHFAEHCRHTFVCFYCGATYPSEAELRVHAGCKHVKLQKIRLEHVEININYVYQILVADALYTERMEFIAKMDENLIKWLREASEMRAQQVTDAWHVPLTTKWLESFPVFDPDFTRKCHAPGCAHITRNEHQFRKHVRSIHPTFSHTYSCERCFLQINNEGGSWDAVLAHIGMHTADIHICCICSFHHYDRRLFAQHIKQMHDLRDVPVVTLLRSKRCTKLCLSFVFAAGRKTFSSIRNCFCCQDTFAASRIDMFVLHLKNAHKLMLRYCCEICDKPLAKLKESDEHFGSNHPSEALKIRCLLASSCHLSVTCLDPLQMLVVGDEARSNSSVTRATDVVIKEEPLFEESDDSITILEEDDLTIAEDVKAQNLKPATAIRKLIGCVNLDKLKGTAQSGANALSAPASVPVPLVLTQQSVPISNAAPPNICTASTNNCNFLGGKALPVRAQERNIPTTHQVQGPPVYISGQFNAYYQCNNALNFNQRQQQPNVCGSRHYYPPGPGIANQLATGAKGYVQQQQQHHQAPSSYEQCDIYQYTSNQSQNQASSTDANALLRAILQL